MNSAEIKLDLFKRIDSLKGKKLEAVYRHMISFFNRQETGAELKEGIERALKDSEEGRVSFHEDVMKRMKKKYPNLVNADAT